MRPHSFIALRSRPTLFSQPSPLRRLFSPARWPVLLGTWILAVTMLSGAEPAQPPGATNFSTEFIRFVKTGPGNGHLDTAIKTYFRPADRASVSLVAVVHIGEEIYYRNLQSLFEEYEAVLYEMVRDEDDTQAPKVHSDHPISQIQIGMKKLLELEFQLDCIDYSRKNFVHADLSPDAFAQLQAERGETILGLLVKAAFEEQRRLSSNKLDALNPFAMLLALTSRDRGHQLKFMLGRQMGQMEDVLAGIDKGSDGKGSAILSGRNEHAMKILAQQIARGRRKLAIFYGGGHMPDLEKRLLAQGFQPRAETWYVAWDVRPVTDVEGWKVHVNEKLSTDEPAATARALEILGAQLAAIKNQLPATAVERLQQVHLWFNPAYPHEQPRAEYHPDRRWLREHGRDPSLAGAVEFTDIPQFEKEEKRMPLFVLHELAHAFHHQVLGFDCPEIAQAFAAARQSGRYDKVKRWTGEKEVVEKAYAMTDAKEYFAETSEAYFGRNDFQPFTREELKTMDPTMARLLEKLWSTVPR